MSAKFNSTIAILAMVFLMFSCKTNTLEESETKAAKAPETASQPEVQTKSTVSDARVKNTYTEFTLKTDLSHLSENQKAMLGILIDISKIMDELFWLQSYGPKQALLDSIQDPDLRLFTEINYGPWDRLNDNKPFLSGYGDKPLGAQFYPEDATKDEITNHPDESVRSLYTMVGRNDQGALVATPYHQAFSTQITQAVGKLREAAALAEDAGFKKYLELRATALETDQYFDSDMAWMDMKSNPIDFVVGPIEVYEDKLFNYKAAHEAYVLIKDMAWSKRLEKYVALLPELQANLPVDPAYKKEEPGTDSDLNAYDVVYYAGDCNAGSKTIAINLPNDEKVQLAKGTRRLQLKNAMQAKFDKILVPLSQVLIAEDQRQHVTFEAFFANTMFHEVAHGLGIKQTINGKGTVRDALLDHSSAIEEGKADILGLYMVSQLLEKGEVEGDIKDYYVTFMASIFRSVRFGGASAHGKANMLRFNFFKEMQAFSRDETTGTYRVNYEKMSEAMAALTKKILMLQGNGDYDGVTQFLKESGMVGSQLKQDLDRLNEAGIPTDIYFSQGKSVLGL